MLGHGLAVLPGNHLPSSYDNSRPPFKTDIRPRAHTRAEVRTLSREGTGIHGARWDPLPRAWQASLNTEKTQAPHIGLCREHRFDRVSALRVRVAQVSSGSMSGYLLFAFLVLAGIVVLVISDRLRLVLIQSRANAAMSTYPWDTD